MNNVEIYVASDEQKIKWITKAFKIPKERDEWISSVLDKGYRESGPAGSVYWPPWAIWKVTTWEE